MKRDHRPAGVRRLLPVLLLIGGLLTTVSVALAQAVFPTEEPEAATGLAIFAERCANCHGPQGMGDGELASRSAVPPTALASPEYLDQAIPSEMFNIITSGIMGDAGPLMPAFGPTSSNPIAEENRWDLIAAIYSLGTPAENIIAGEAIYADSCAECHGEDGNEAFDLTAPAYWLERSNAQVVDVLAGDTIPEHAYDLGDDALAQVVDYSRSLSYVYEDPLAAFAPIAEGEISGQVLNGTLDETLTEPLSVTLNAFTMDFQVALTQTATLADDGTFSFVVNDVDPDWFYVARLDYGGLQYGSDFGELERSDPTLSLPVTVYETTSEPAGISIAQMHIILQFGQDQVLVSELYQFSNNSTRVYMGSEGDPDQGTVTVALPEGAQNVEFNRAFGSLDNLFPANDLIQTERGWAETSPVRPGQGTVNLLVRYTLPYEDELDLVHPVYYDVQGGNLVIPGSGVEVAQGEQWIRGEVQAMQGGSFQTYNSTGITAGEDIQVPLRGEPEDVPAAGAGAIATGEDNLTELLVGGGVLLLAVGAGAYYVSLQRRRGEEESQQLVDASAAATDALAQRREDLLLAIAELDEAYEQGEVDQENYERERQELKERLVAVWEAGEA